MVPTCQSFDGDHASGLDVDDRLVMHLQLISPNRLAQIHFQRASTIGFGLHLSRINLEAIAPLPFRFVKGKVGVSQDLVDALTMRGNQGDPDAAADDDGAAVDFIRCADSLDQSRRRIFAVCGRSSVPGIAITANSSPPRRAAKSTSRHMALIRPATPLRSVSPA